MIDNNVENIDGALTNGIEKVPMTVEQKNLWFLSNYNATSNKAYNEILLFNFIGALDLARLSIALDRLLNRHTIFSASFTIDGCFLSTSEKLCAEVLTADFSSGVDMAADVRLWMDKISQKEFDLTVPPLIGFFLARLGGNQNLLCVVAHHIIMDGLSSEIFIKELSHFYNNGVDGHSLAPSTSIIDFNRDYFDKINHSHDISAGFWCEMLRESQDLLELPYDKVRPDSFSFAGDHYCVSIGPHDRKLLLSLGVKNRATLFMVLFTIYNIFLSKYCNQTDITVGVPASQREGDFISCIGHCTTVFPLRSLLDIEKTFADNLHAVKLNILSAMSYGRVDFGKVADELGLEWDHGRASPFFDVMFNYDRISRNSDFYDLDVEYFSFSSPVKKLEIKTFSSECVKIQSDFSKADLSVNMVDDSSQLFCDFEFRSDLFEVKTIKRMASHFKVLVESILKNPDLPLKDLEIMGSKEKRRLLYNLNCTQRSYPHEKTFCDLFVEQANEHPENIAVECGQSKLTYAGVMRKARACAIRLMDLGACHGNIVVIMAERSELFLPAIIGIWLCGCVYLPVDPKVPLGRLQNVLAKSQAKYILTNASLIDKSKKVVERLSSDGSVKSLKIEKILCDQYFSIEKFRMVGVPRLFPEDSAYIIFTSGSTGEPKGAIIRHDGMLNHLFAKVYDLKLSKFDVVSQNSSQCFDISVWQFFAVLLKGGRVEVMPDSCIYDPLIFLSVIVDKKVTILEVVPTMLEIIVSLVKENSGMVLNGLRRVLVTGEALLVKLYHDWARVSPGIPLINAYGPTECSDDVTHYELHDPSIREMSIGFPIINTRLYVLDRAKKLLPRGCVGELYVSGVGVGAGYLNDAQKTQERFLENPWSIGPKDGVMYRTGDIVKWLPDGSVKYYGRADNQIKINGFRIELEEVECALLQLSEIADCVAAIAGDKDKFIAAYFVLNAVGYQEKTFVELTKVFTTHLEKYLPHYMIPRTYVRLEKIPLTPNGKIDRKKLPKPYLANISNEKVLKGPSSEIEVFLVKVWQTLLNREKIGVNENFFKIGGSSVSSIRMTMMLRKEGHQIVVEDVFKYPTIKMLGEYLGRGTSQSFTIVRSVRDGGTKLPLILIHDVTGLSSGFYTKLSNYMVDRQVFVIDSPRFINVEKTFLTVEEMSAYYLEQVRSIKLQNFCIGGWSFGGVVAYEMARQYEQFSNKKTFVLMVDSFNPDFYSKLGEQINSVEYIEQFSEIMSKKLLNQMQANDHVIKLLTSEIQNNLDCLSRYVPKKILSPVMLLKAINCEQENGVELSAQAEGFANGWHDVRGLNLNVLSVEGRHEELFDDINIQGLEKCVNFALDMVVLRG